MGLITRALTRAVGPAATSITKYRTSPKNDPRASYAVSLQRLRRIAKTNPAMYRAWSWGSPPVRAAIDIRKGQVETADWDLVRFSRDMPDPDKGLMRRIREVLEEPNPGDASYGSFMSAVAEDLLTLDAGVIEKERMVRGEIAYLWPVDGGVVAVDRFWDGNPREPRYYWNPAPTIDVPLLNSDLVYMMTHRRTDMPIGVSYLETLKGEVDAVLNGMLVNAHRVTTNAPDGIMDMGENARQEQVDAFRSYFESELAGTQAVGFWGGTKSAKFIDFGRKNVEMQFVEWIQLNIRLIAIVFQLSPQDLGLLFDVNRASAQTQQENTEDRGQRTVLSTIQRAITAEVCWDPGWGGRRNNIAFRYRQATDRSSFQKAETKKITAGNMPLQSINMARADLGWEPIGDPSDASNPYNQLMANTPLGLVTLDKVPTAYDVTMGKIAQQAAAKATTPATTPKRTPAKAKG